MKTFGPDANKDVVVVEELVISKERILLIATVVVVFVILLDYTPVGLIPCILKNKVIPKRSDKDGGHMP